MVAAEVISEYYHGWASLMVLVRKKDGSLRMCIDYHKVNAKTITDAYALPRIEGALDAMAGSKTCLIQLIDCSVVSCDSFLLKTSYICQLKGRN